VDVHSVLGDVTLPGGHIEIFSAQPLAVAETFQGDNVLATVAGEGNSVSGSDGKWSILFPAVTTASGYWTGIAYLNQSGAGAYVTLTVFDQSGAIITSQSTILDAKAQKAINVADLAQGWNGTGYILLTSDSPISGLQVVGTPSGRIFGWDAVRDFARELFVPHIAEIGDWASALSVVNPNATAVQVTLDAFDSSGQAVHTEQFQLVAKSQSSLAVGKLDGLAGQSGGSLRLTASAPIVAADQFQNSAGVASVVAAPAADVQSRFVPAVVVASAAIKAATGATLTVPNSSPNVTLGGLNLAIPPGAVTQDTQIQVAYTLPTMIDSDLTAQLVQYPIRLLPEGLHLQQPAQLTIPVYSALVANTDSSVAGVTVTRHDNLAKAWVGVPTTGHDSIARTVTVQIDVSGDYVATIPAGQPFTPTATASTGIPHSPMLFQTLEPSGTTFDAACIATDQIGAINSLQRSLPEPIDDLLGALCASIQAASQFNKGDVVGGINTIGKEGIKIGAEAGVTLGCQALAGAAAGAASGGAAALPAAIAAEGPCAALSSEAVFVTEQVGAFLGQRASDLVSADRNIAAFDSQVQRYVGWLAAGIPSNAIPTCPGGGFYPDPALGIQLFPPNCRPADLVPCGPAALAVTPSYPCNPLAQNDFYSPAAVAQFATVLFKEMPKLGQEATDLKNALITLGQQLTPRLSASFTISPGAQGAAPFQVSVDASASEPQAAITRYLWNFGDGASATGIRASHTYSAPGPYTITLRIADSTGTMSQATNNIVALQSAQTAPPSSQSPSPVLTLQQNAVAVPGAVSVNGSGFLPRTAVVVSAVGEPGPVYSSSPVLTDANGNLSYTFVFDASTPPSRYDVFAKEQSSSPRYSNTLTLTLTAKNHAPTASRLSPPTVNTNTPTQAGPFAFLISGSGFVVQSFVRVVYAATGSYGGVPRGVGETAATVTSTQVSSDGNSLGFSASLYIGAYTVVVINPDGQSTAPLALTVSPSPLGVSLSVGEAPASGSLQVATSDGSKISGTITVQGVSWVNFGGQASFNLTTPALVPVTVDPTGLQVGSYSAALILTVAQASNSPLTVPVSLQIGQALQILSPANLPDAVAGQGYSYSLQATGGGGYAWQLASGSSLPDGLILNGSTGVISGTPAASMAGVSRSFKIAVLDSSGRTASQTFTIKVTVDSTAQAPTVTSVTPNPVPQASATAATLTVAGSGFRAGLTVQLTAPNGIPQTITVSQGVATAAFAFAAVLNVPGTWSLRVINPGGAASAPFPFSVTGVGALSVSPSSFSPQFTVGDPAASLAFQIRNQSTGILTGGISAVTDNGQPWLTVNGHTSYNWVAPESVTVSADPTGYAAGKYTGKITVTSPNASNSPVTIPVTMTILAALQITTASLPNAVAGQSYSIQLQAAGGTGYTWSLESGNLPAGLTLSASGLISGVPTGPGSSTFNIGLRDAAGRFIYKTFSITFQQAIGISFNGPSNFQFVVGNPYGSDPTISFSASGGAAPYSWSATGMPSGLNVNATTGVIAGTPTQPGAYSATVTATDSQGRSGNRAFTLTVTTTPLTITDNRGQSPPVLPSGTVGVAYSQFLLGAGGSQTNYTWAVTGGTLPPGITTQNGPGCPSTCSLQILGTPTQVGTYTFTVRVSDPLGNTATATITLVINGGTPTRITTTTLTRATVGQAYSYSFAATSGTPPYQWAFVGGSPDSSLQLSSGGVLSGTSSVANDCLSGPGIWVGSQYPSVTFQVKVTDAANQSSIGQFCLPAYYPTPAVTGVTPASVTVDGQNKTITVNGSNFRNGAYIYMSGQLPTTFVSGNALSFNLAPRVGVAYGVPGGTGFNEGSYTLWVVQPYSDTSNQDKRFAIYDPAPTVSSVQAVLNNTTQPCKPNLSCQLVVNGSGLVYATQYLVTQGNQSLTRVQDPGTPIPWNTVTTSVFSVSAAGTYTVQVTNPNQASGTPATVSFQFVVSP